jgi:hypothetical protein
MLAHDVRGGRWWYGSRGWTSPSPIVCKFCCRVTAAEEQFYKMASDMEVHTKQRCVNEFHHA